MSLDVIWKSNPKGVKVSRVGTHTHYKYWCEQSAWEGDTSQAEEVTTPIWGLFVDGLQVPSTNLFILPDGRYLMSARCESADILIKLLEKEGKKYYIY